MREKIVALLKLTPKFHIKFSLWFKVLNYSKQFGRSFYLLTWLPPHILLLLLKRLRYYTAIMAQTKLNKFKKLRKTKTKVEMLKKIKGKINSMPTI